VNSVYEFIWKYTKISEIDIRQSFRIVGRLCNTTDYIRHAIVCIYMTFDTTRPNASVVLQVSKLIKSVCLKIIDPFLWYCDVIYRWSFKARYIHSTNVYSTNLDSTKVLKNKSFSIMDSFINHLSILLLQRSVQLTVTCVRFKRLKRVHWMKKRIITITKTDWQSKLQESLINLFMNSQIEAKKSCQVLAECSNIYFCSVLQRQPLPSLVLILLFNKTEVESQFK